MTKNKHYKKLTRILLISVILVITIWSFTFIAVNYFEKPGMIGDSFGMVNALFSALAFALLIYTSLLQTEELKLQRKELKENRQELKRSADAHRELVQLTTRQNEMMIEQNKLMLNLNIKNIHPQLDNLAIIEHTKKVLVFEFQVVNRPLEITDILDASQDSILDDGALVTYPADYFEYFSYLDPNEKVQVQLNNYFGSFYLEYKSETGVIYWQQITLADGGYNLVPPEIINKRLF